MRRFADWLFSNPRIPCSPWSVVVWWEVRRLSFNLIVGAYGVFCFVVFIYAITSSGHLQAREDAVEPIALLAAPLGVNALYTLGLLAEVSTRLLVPALSPGFGPLLLKLGLGMGILLTILPAGFWGGYRLLQLAGAVP